MQSRLLFAALFATCLAACSREGDSRLLHRAQDKQKPVGLCVRTATDGYVVLEARVVTSSGDLKADAAAVENVIGQQVPLPNQRMWFEWLSMQVGQDARSNGAGTPMPDCSVLDRSARASAKYR